MAPARSILAALALCLVSAGAPLLAGGAPREEAYEWHNAKVGGGGFAPNIVFSRAEPDLAYLRTDMGGAYRWDAQAARWIPLQDHTAEGSYLGIESIAADPVDPDKVYLAAGMYKGGEAAIWRSADRGASWNVVEVPFAMGGNEAGRGLGERLAIDPNATDILYFGSRHDGLQRSTDAGRSWRKVASFPHEGLGTPEGRGTNAGISFVLFDPTSGTPGSRSRIVYAAVADPGPQHLFRSDDAGESWRAVPGGPGAEMLPVKGAIADDGTLYIAYCDAIGPNGIDDGAVWKLSPAGEWTDITPKRGGDREGGYMGLALDRNSPGRLALSSVDRWGPGDTVWLSENGGTSWTDLKPRSRRDTRATPFLNWGEDEAEFGHWTAGLAIDPFDGGTIAYTTGATVYRTDDAGKRRLEWRPWVEGVEQTAVITLVSPADGAAVISGFGDLGGFVHDDLAVSPPTMHLNPRLTNTNNLDYAGQRPEVVVRSGSLHAEHRGEGASLAWSGDGGHSWTPLRVLPLKLGDSPARRFDLTGDAAIDVSADGGVFAVATPVGVVTRDRGESWQVPDGLPAFARMTADKVDPELFYAVDFAANTVLVSRDGARSFAPAAGKGLPRELAWNPARKREAQYPLKADPRRAGHLWFLLGGALYHSADGAGSFRRATGRDAAIEEFGLGLHAPDRDLPALYAVATVEGQRGVWRSDDGGAHWVRINDDAHQWGLRFRAISGDPRRYGRVYLATDGRGLIYGDPAAEASHESPASGTPTREGMQ